ncbi:hypothetical protein BLNAU_17686 [Blattamonas nauphoetae]|uniref:Uncharacterized protein n=1 Tax=Blattamonas nauphoetae TaxID=2049346 RepID=A0ABQ9XAP7_9EUKA|nr:hypothetical protein BLNAU_17686 [Blattamonas nauphoetae]
MKKPSGNDLSVWNEQELIAENKAQQALKEQQTATATAAMRRAKPAARTVNREPIQRAPTVSESGGSIQPKPVAWVRHLRRRVQNAKIPL